MKILDLRLKNLNSLYGEWHIDFTDPEYLSNGIFALTGPTGSGKSTILDAICLALYGSTPRLGRITGSDNEIMSRQTGECFSEVTFESRSGRFVCHWGQHRARRKADGKLAEAQHEISDALTGKPLETKKSLVTGVVEEKTGMDFDRFTRSTLLAQGSFDTFLKADAEEKSKVLEQITGTDIYTDISIGVHERRREEHRQLELLRAEASGIVLLEPEEKENFHRTLEEKKKAEIRLSKKVAETRKAVEWLTVIHSLRKELRSLSEDSQDLNTQRKSFLPERERLNRARKAATLDGQYASLTALRTQQSSDRQSLLEQREKLPTLEAEILKTTTSLEKAEGTVREAGEAQKKAAPLIQRVRALDHQIKSKKELMDNVDRKGRNISENIETDLKVREESQKVCDAARKELLDVLNYLDTHAADEELVSSFTGIREQLNTLLSMQRDISQKEELHKQAKEHLVAAEEKLSDRGEQHESSRQALADVRETLTQREKDLEHLLDGRLLREYRTEKENLLTEMTYLRKIESLESERSRLEDGTPCPLCGSPEHPYARGNTPETGGTEKRIAQLTELIEEAENLEGKIKKLEAIEAASLKETADYEKLEYQADIAQKNAQKSLNDAEENLNLTETGFTRLRGEILQRLEPLGIQDLSGSDIPSLTKTLEDRLSSWKDANRQKDEIEKKISEYENEINKNVAVNESRKETLDEARNEKSELRKEYEELTHERGELFGSENPDTEETRLKDLLSGAVLTEKSARENYEGALHLLTSAKARIDSLEAQIEKRETGLEEMETEFQESLKASGFEGENNFLDCRVPREEQSLLEERAKDLDDRDLEVRTRITDRNERLENELKKNLTDADLESMQPDLEAAEDRLNQLRNEIADLKNKLETNRSAEERIMEKQTDIESRKKDCERWDKLHQLIGSADGKKYRTFAQGLTFEMMVSFANRQLEKMTDRYLLIRNETAPLELDVLDNYQAGEKRSTRNLSGGESFIVSLTLALGLSKMAGRKVRVDSLFLDEGFGSLDEETLETALETLSSLQQDGKLIGIISHVPALKERIGTQIAITPVSGGKSTVTGPGCERIDR